MPVTFITGASSGIGRSLALRIACEGHAVAAVARREALLNSLVNEIKRLGGKAMAIPCDATNPSKVYKAIQLTEANLGPIDRLVANAGGGEPTFVDTFNAAHVERVLALNVLSAANCIEAVLPDMLARRKGHIVVTSSLAAYRGLPSAAAYSAAKAALTNMMESLRIDLKPRGIDVTILLPGFVQTKPSQGKSKLFKMDLEDATAKMHQAILTHRPCCAFPASLVLVFGLGRLLPASLYDWLLVGRGRKPKAEPKTALNHENKGFN